MRFGAVIAAMTATVVLLSGCGAVGGTAGGTSVAGITLPPPGADFDYQLGGGYTPADGVEIVARDSTDEPSGLYDICYVNGFQTQPGEGESWVADDPDLVLMDGGEPLIDPGWPDEYLLDTSTVDKRERIAARFAAVITGCRDDGFDAVEIDNLDSWTRSKGALTFDDSVAMARLFAGQAHAAGLAIAQKNGAGDSARLRDAVGFDFAVTEECLRYDECADYTATYGEHVYDIEYPEDEDPSVVLLHCDDDAAPARILRDRDLTKPDDADYVRLTCP